MNLIRIGQIAMVVISVVLVVIMAMPVWATIPWESQLFPKEGDHYKFTKVRDFELPDFSHAGYHSGEMPIPNVAVKKEIGPIEGDNANHIRAALKEAAGGALLLKQGTYRIRSKSEIVIPANTVLKGSGTDKTFIFVDIDNTGQSSVIVGNRSKNTDPRISRWEHSREIKTDIVGDVPNNVSVLSVKTTDGFSVGDWVVIKNEVNDDFRKEYNGVTKVKGKTIWPSDRSSIKFLRRITHIDVSNITIDRPITHVLKGRDNPHVMKVTCMASEIGVEDLSIGFRTPSDYPKYHDGHSKGQEATYHNSAAIQFGNVVNGWIRNVKTYSPQGNNIHIHSRGIVLANSRYITVENCDLGYPANIGGGGNGYIYVISMSNDCLIRNCVAREGRHNFLFSYTSSGNVISSCKSFKSLLPNDFHHSLSIGNLVENMQITCSHSKSNAFQTKNRGSGSCGAGITGTNNVFWRIAIDPDDCTIYSRQASAGGGKGYVIGVTAVSGPSVTDASEWREGIGSDAGLRPASLYSEQLSLRLGREKKALGSVQNLRLIISD